MSMSKLDLHFDFCQIFKTAVINCWCTGLCFYLHVLVLVK